MSRQSARNAPPPAQTSVQPLTHAEPAAHPVRAPRTAEEESYLRVLWPIHGEVERSAMRLSLGQIFYKTDGLPREELKTRVEEALAAFQAAEKKLHGLAPPASLRGDHDTYVASVRLFAESALEVRKMFADGSDDHMLAAYPRSQEASDRIREVGGKLWPHEFPPH